MIGLSSKANTDNFVFKILEKQKAASAQSKDNARQMEEMEQIIKISQEQLETLKKRKEEFDKESQVIRKTFQDELLEATRKLAMNAYTGHFDTEPFKNVILKQRCEEGFIKIEDQNVPAYNYRFAFATKNPEDIDEGFFYDRYKGYIFENSKDFKLIERAIMKGKTLISVDQSFNFPSGTPSSYEVDSFGVLIVFTFFYWLNQENVEEALAKTKEFFETPQDFKLGLSTCFIDILYSKYFPKTE